MNTAEVFTRGYVSAWIEQSDTVHLKAVDEHGDPVELSAEELKALIDELSRLYGNITTKD
jgi:methionyl-tRNA synthetase